MEKRRDKIHSKNNYLDKEMEHVLIDDNIDPQAASVGSAQRPASALLKHLSPSPTCHASQGNSCPGEIS